LFVSTTSLLPSITDYEYSSRLVDPYDRIVINATSLQVNLNFPIYISVYAAARASFYIDLHPFFMDTYNT